MLTAIVPLLLLLGAPAWAGPCDALVKKADAAQGTALATAYRDLAKCDKNLAESSFFRLMSNAKDSDALVELSLTAIDSETWTPVWSMIGKITSYEARDEVSQRIGEACTEHPSVIKFLQGGYFALRDLDFGQWDNALAACPSDELTAWMATQMESPPNSVYDEKFNTLATAYAHKEHAAALPHLAKGALKAAKGGPFDTMLTQMDEAVAPGIGETMSPENRKALEDALVSVAKDKSVGPAQARAVADKLANAGNEAAAAGLLPSVYPDRVQSGGSFLYGAAAVEASDCKGVKTAVVHFAPVTDPGTRWSILADIDGPIKASKPKLDKCTSDGPWAVAASPEPVASSKAVADWANSVAAVWTEKGYTVTTKEEKAIALK